MNIKKVKPNIIKQNYLDLQCPHCKSKAVIPFEKLACIFFEEIKAKFVCESCYHVFGNTTQEENYE